MNKELQEVIMDIEQKLEAHKSKMQGLATQLQSARAYIQQSEPELMSLAGAVKELEDMKKKIISLSSLGEKIEEKKDEEKIDPKVFLQDENKKLQNLEKDK